jgi:hypothetical protein
MKGRIAPDQFADFAILSADYLTVTWRWKLQAGAGVDLTPSMHWPAPLTTHPIDHDRGPVFVTVEYRIRPQDRQQFLQTIEQLGNERRRDGVYRWGVFEEATKDASSGPSSSRLGQNTCASTSE